LLWGGKGVGVRAPGKEYYGLTVSEKNIRWSGEYHIQGDCGLGKRGKGKPGNGGSQIILFERCRRRDREKEEKNQSSAGERTSSE